MPEKVEEPKSEEKSTGDNELVLVSRFQPDITYTFFVRRSVCLQSQLFGECLLRGIRVHTFGCPGRFADRV